MQPRSIARLGLLISFMSFRAAVEAFLLLLFAVTASEPAQAADSPEQVVTRYVAATRALEWGELAALMHSTALGDFKSLMRQVVEIDSTGEAAQALFQVGGLAAYDSLPPPEAFERLMKTITERNPMLTEALTSTQATIIGHVSEGEDLVHVVYRVGMASGAVDVSKIEVVSLKREGKEWRTLLTGNIQGLAEALRQTVGGQSLGGE